MGTFRELYNRLVDAALRNDLEKEVREITESGEYGREEVDRLLHPMEHPVVMRTEDCKCPPWENCEQCAVECLFSAIDWMKTAMVISTLIAPVAMRGGIKNKVLTDRRNHSCSGIAQRPEEACLCHDRTCLQRPVQHGCHRRQTAHSF